MHTDCKIERKDIETEKYKETKRQKGRKIERDRTVTYFFPPLINQIIAVSHTNPFYVRHQLNNCANFRQRNISEATVPTADDAQGVLLSASPSSSRTAETFLMTEVGAVRTANPVYTGHRSNKNNNNSVNNNSITSGS